MLAAKTMSVSSLCFYYLPHFVILVFNDSYSYTHATHTYDISFSN